MEVGIGVSFRDGDKLKNSERVKVWIWTRGMELTLG